MTNEFKQKKLRILIVVSTILVLILSLAIGVILRQNGIIKESKMERDEYLKAYMTNEEILQELEEQLQDYNEKLPESTPSTNAGTEVKLPAGWSSVKSAEISTISGRTITEVTRVASVTAVSLGNDEVIPVPIGFYYVGGMIHSGVVISDNEKDRNKYAGVENVPAGVVYNSDGTPKSYTDEEYNNLSEADKKAVILGNQFVWIPVTENEYVKTDWGKANATWERQTNTAELAQIEKYGGFYIGRYEAGTSQISLSTGVNFAGANSASGWANDAFSIRNGLNHTATGKITTKAGEVPYYHADYETSVKLSKGMYSNQYVQSGLVTGTMWDAMMRFIADGNNSVVTSSAWGNYTDGSVTYTAGQGRYSVVSTGTNHSNSAFTVSNGNYNYGIKTTAISESVKKKNLYDVAGNLWEWTQEASYPSTTESYMLRGGSFSNSYTEYPACFRVFDTVADTSTRAGFRPTLYIK